MTFEEYECAQRKKGIITALIIICVISGLFLYLNKYLSNALEELDFGTELTQQNAIEQVMSDKMTVTMFMEKYCKNKDFKENNRIYYNNPKIEFDKRQKFYTLLQVVPCK